MEVRELKESIKHTKNALSECFWRMVKIISVNVYPVNEHIVRCFFDKSVIREIRIEFCHNCNKGGSCRLYYFLVARIRIAIIHPLWIYKAICCVEHCALFKLDKLRGPENIEFCKSRVVHIHILHKALYEIVTRTRKRLSVLR